MIKSNTLAHYAEVARAGQLSKGPMSGSNVREENGSGKMHIRSMPYGVSLMVWCFRPDYLPRIVMKRFRVGYPGQFPFL